MAKGLNRKERGQRRKTSVYDEAPFIQQPKKYLEKKLKRYVIADPESGQYLCKISFSNHPSYVFTKSIVKATKTISEIDAKFVIEFYRKDTGDKMDLVIIPLEITYELINETIDSEITDSDYLADIGGFQCKRSN